MTALGILGQARLDASPTTGTSESVRPDVLSALPPVVHLSAREGLSSVFLSQVAEPMRYLADGGVAVRLAMMCALGEFVRSAGRRAWSNRRAELDATGLQWTRLPSAPSRLERWAPDRAVLTAWIKRRLAPQRRLIFHCRGTAATHLALAMRHRFPAIRVVSDCRGVDGPEQALYRGVHAVPSSEESRWIRNLEDSQRAALSGSDAVLCVSQAMRTYLVDTWKLGEEKIGVVPCCYSGRRPTRDDDNVAAVRKKHNFDGKVVFAYSASDAPWQRTGDVIQLCSQLSRRLPEAHFLFLTWKPDSIAKQLQNNGVAPGRSTILALRHKDVAPHLAAADIGILLRDESLVNRVASPVKSAEYLAAGLPIIVTSNLGDYSELISRERIGVVAPGADVDDEFVEAIVQFARQPKDRLREHQLRARAVADRELSWSSYLPVLRHAYLMAAAAA